MSTKKPHHAIDRETYILRLWREPPKGLNWRGQVHHVSSGQVFAFQGIQTLLVYLQQRLETTNSESEHADERNDGIH